MSILQPPMAGQNSDERLLRMLPHERAGLVALVDTLRECYGDNLLRVTLFGSKARGDAGRESDLDMLIVARMKEGTYRQHWNKIVDMASSIELMYGIVMSLVIKDEREYEMMRAHPLLLARNIERDGIVLWTLPSSAPTLARA